MHIKLTWAISERGNSPVSYINNLQKGLRVRISSVNLAKTKSVDNVMRVVKPWRDRAMVMVLREKGRMSDALLHKHKHLKWTKIFLEFIPKHNSIIMLYKIKACGFLSRI